MTRTHKYFKIKAPKSRRAAVRLKSNMLLPTIMTSLSSLILKDTQWFPLRTITKRKINKIRRTLTNSKFRIQDLINKLNNSLQATPSLNKVRSPSLSSLIKLSWAILSQLIWTLLKTLRCKSSKISLLNRRFSSFNSSNSNNREWINF